MQILHLHGRIDKLQKLHGDKNLCSIYGGGCIKNPRVMFIFMNPTGRNVSSQRTWKGVRVPWLGTKNIWKLFYGVGLMSDTLYATIQSLSSHDWTPDFSRELYAHLETQKAYITNLGKCTQADARPLHNRIFHEYLPIMHEEINAVNPQSIITFGNQVSSILIGHPIRVSDYRGIQHEEILIRDRSYPVYPVYYPVGQGMRNMSHAIKRIRSILTHA